jgi:hypothetical protein
MAIRLLSPEYRSMDQASAATTHSLLRATGIMALFGIAVIHFVQLVPTFKSTPLLGVAFLALIAGSVFVGARLVMGAPSQMLLWGPVALLGVGAIAGYAFTRVLSTPFDNQDVGNWSCMLGLGALLVESLLVAMSIWAMRLPVSSRHASIDTGVPARNQNAHLFRSEAQVHPSVGRS